MAQEPLTEEQKLAQVRTNVASMMVLVNEEKALQAAWQAQLVSNTTQNDAQRMRDIENERHRG